MINKGKICVHYMSPTRSHRTNATPNFNLIIWCWSNMLVQNFPPAAYVLNVLSQSKRSAASVRSYFAGLQLRLLLLLRLELYQTVMPETAPHMDIWLVMQWHPSIQEEIWETVLPNILQNSFGSKRKKKLLQQRSCSWSYFESSRSPTKPNGA